MAAVIGAAIGGVLQGHFYNAKVDKTREAVQKVLNQMNEMSQSLMATGFSGMSMQRIELFNAINLQLQNFTVVYADMLDLTVKKIGKEASSQLYQIDTIVHDLTKEVTGPEMQKQISKLAGIALNLPLLKDIPRLVAFFPTFVAPSGGNYNVLIECAGTFPTIPGSTRRLKPILLVGEKKFFCIQNPSLKIHFSVPFNDLFPQDEKPSTTMRMTSFTVRIPYIEKGWIYNSATLYEFKGSVTLLPDSPGKVVLQFTKFKEIIETKEISSHSYIQNSRKNGLNKTLENQPYTLSTELGWQIVPGSQEFLADENKGDRKTAAWSLASVQPSHVTYLVSTFHYDPPKHCDKLTFHVTAIVSRTFKTTETSTEEVSLKWGDSITIDPSKGDFTASYVCFDGTTTALQPNTFEKYVTLAMRDGKSILSAKAPEYIASFNFHQLLMAKL
jgi:hypothetical protein